MPQAFAPKDQIHPDVIRQVLAAPLGPDNTLGRDDATIRDYLVESLAELVAGELNDEYGLKGSDDWRYDLYAGLANAGLLPPLKNDGWGLPTPVQERADVLLAAASRALVAPVA